VSGDLGDLGDLEISQGKPWKNGYLMGYPINGSMFMLWGYPIFMGISWFIHV
jgi:hypothetical protein